MSDYVPLCHRCEHRIRWYETKGQHQPRCECAGGDSYDAAKGKMPSAKCGCYMFQPVKPIVQAPIEGEDRPLLPVFSHFSGRSYGVRLAEGKMSMRVYEDGVTWYWLPKRGINPIKEGTKTKTKTKTNTKRKGWPKKRKKK